MRDVFQNESIKIGRKKSTALKDSPQKVLAIQKAKAQQKLDRIQNARADQVKHFANAASEKEKLEKKIIELEEESQRQQRAQEEAEAQRPEAAHVSSREDQIQALENALNHFGNEILDRNFNAVNVFQISSVLVGEDLAREFTQRIENRRRREEIPGMIVEEQKQG